MLACKIVSCIIEWLLSCFFVLASLARMSTLPFCSLGICVSSKNLNLDFNSCTLARYCISISSLVLNAPVTWPVPIVSCCGVTQELVDFVAELVEGDADNRPEEENIWTRLTAIQ